MYQYFLLGEITSQQGMSPDPRKVQVLTDMPPLRTKMELQLFLGIVNYLSKFSPMTTMVWQPLQKLTSVMEDQTCNRMYQDLYKRANKIVKKYACMKFYDAARPLYLEIDASGTFLQPDYYRQGMTWIVGIMKYWTMQYCTQLHLSAKV